MSLSDILPNSVEIDKEGKIGDQYRNSIELETQEKYNSIGTVNTEDKLYKALDQFKDLLGHYPTIREWNDNRHKVGIKTSGDHISRNTGMGIYEARNNLGADKSRYQARGIRHDLTEEMKSPSSEKGYLLGVVLGDASVGYYGGDWKFSMDVADKEFAEKTADTLEEWITDGRAEVKVRGPMHKGENARPQWRIMKGLKEPCKELDRVQELSYDEIVEEFKGYEKSILRGLWDAEGHITNNGGVGFTNTDIKIIKLYIEMLYKTVDVKVSKYWRWASSKRKGVRSGDVYLTVQNKDKHKDCMKVIIPKIYTAQFNETIQSTILRKKKRMDEVEVKQTHQLHTKTITGEKIMELGKIEEMVNGPMGGDV